jgi:hypothetical protein
LTPAEFDQTYRPQAEAVALGTGLLPDTLITQWAVETNYGNEINNRNNLGNIRCVSGIPCVGGFSQFPSFDSFCAVCINTFHNGYYNNVLTARGLPAQLMALAASPWDAGHYDGGVSLVEKAIQLGFWEGSIMILPTSDGYYLLTGRFYVHVPTPQDVTILQSGGAVLATGPNISDDLHAEQRICYPGSASLMPKFQVSILLIKPNNAPGTSFTLMVEAPTYPDGLKAAIPQLVQELKESGLAVIEPDLTPSVPATPAAPTASTSG